jgi:hypothetical protein
LPQLLEKAEMKNNLAHLMTISAALAVSQTQAFWGKGHLIGKQQKQFEFFMVKTPSN